MTYLLLIAAPPCSPNLHACCRLSLALADPVPLIEYLQPEMLGNDGTEQTPYECPICDTALYWRETGAPDPKRQNWPACRWTD